MSSKESQASSHPFQPQPSRGRLTAARPAFGLCLPVCDVSTFPFARNCPASCPLVFALFSQRVDRISFSSVALISSSSRSICFHPSFFSPFFFFLSFLYYWHLIQGLCKALWHFPAKFAMHLTRCFLRALQSAEQAMNHFSAVYMFGYNESSWREARLSQPGIYDQFL